MGCLYGGRGHTPSMTAFSDALQHGTSHAWLFIPTAILLGALHGLEPGHSKTMMAAFIIAIRGTVFQAVLLGLSAAISHSLIIWLLAATALRYGSHWSAETTEPYFQLFSAVMIAGLGFWMFWRTRRDSLAAAAHEHEHHHHDHEHDAKVIDTGHGVVNVSIFETGVPPVFRLTFSDHGKSFLPEASSVAVELLRVGDLPRKYDFVAREGFLESTTDIPEPHEFDVMLTFSRDGHTHSYPVQFREEDHGHDHHHDHGDLPSGAEFQDAHEAAHALDIQKRFRDRTVTTPQIVLFGLTGGLMPCPAAFTVLIVCLQVKQFTLGFALVAAFSLGLAMTMVTVGVIAAWTAGHAEKKFRGFGNLMRKAPYLSFVLLLVLASYMAWHGWRGLMGHS